jgi:hypothetical protein
MDITAETKPAAKGFDKSKAVAFLESCCPKLTQFAQERGEWDAICKHPFPSLAAEQFAMFLALKDTNAIAVYGTMERAIYHNVRRVKRQLIWRNMTLLEAFENSMLQSSIEFCQKQDAVKPIGAHMTDRCFTGADTDATAVG